MRSDLVIDLARTAMRSDKSAFEHVLKAIINEEQKKGNKVIAQRLNEILCSKNSNPQLLNPKVADLLYHDQQKMDLSEMVFSDEVIKFIDSLVKEHEKRELLQKYNLEPRNRVLLIGPPGNGKTSLAAIIATKLDVPLFSVNYSGLICRFMGETSGKMQSIFDEVGKQKCVLFFDEFDIVGKTRSDTNEVGEVKRVLSALLMHMDRLANDVVFVAATNLPEALDKAVWRRFQAHLTLPKPNNNQLNAFIDAFVTKHNLDVFGCEQELVKSLQGKSYSEAQDFLNTVLREFALGEGDLSFPAVFSTAANKHQDC